MTLTIDIDEDTRKQLVMEAVLAGKSLEDYAADRLKAGSPAAGSFGRPNLGWAKGLIRMSDDFDAPLDEFKDYI
jgi:hypothetical protein